MKEVGNNQRHCEVCKHTVHDFSKSSLAEINSIMEAAKGDRICGNYQKRHTTNKKGYALANFIENKLVKINMRRASVFLVAIVLIFSGCSRKHVRGRRMMGAKFMNPNKQTSESYKSEVLQPKK
jgi:hypothetical protein